MEPSEAIKLARAALYPKGLPHPGCDAVSIRYDPTKRYHVVNFPFIRSVNRHTPRKLARRGEPIPPDRSVFDPSVETVLVDRDTGKARVDRL